MIQEVNLSYVTINCPICEYHLLDNPNIDCGFCNKERKINTIESKEEFQERVRIYRIDRQTKIKNVANTRIGNNIYTWSSFVSFLNNNL